MKKIPSLFARNYDGDRLVRDEVVPGCEWVLAGEGVPTRKYDGTCCLIKDGVLYKRYDAKRGKQPPPDFTPAQDPDPITGHWTGWVPLGDGPEDCYHWAAWRRIAYTAEVHYPDGVIGVGWVFPPDGTYELVGPKVQGGAEQWAKDHILVRHGAGVRLDPPNPRTFEEIRVFLADFECEGIVWHHPDGRMCKIKRRDFGLPWPVKEAK